MSNSKIILGSLLGTLILFLLYVGSAYNGLIQQDQQIQAQWAQVETQYQRRFDLIPNLVSATKGLMKQEQKVFGDLANARQAYASAPTTDGKAAAASQVEGALSRLLAIVENYPQLKSDRAVQGLMDELAGTENRISVERMRYNEAVRDYNTRIRQFPTRFIANFFDFQSKSYFETTNPAVSSPPTVEL